MSPESFNRLQNTSKEGLDRFVNWLFSHTLAELKAARGDSDETRAVWIRYFRRGLSADMLLDELMRHVTELLRRTRYPKDEALRVIEMLKKINFAELGIKPSPGEVKFDERID